MATLQMTSWALRVRAQSISTAQERQHSHHFPRLSTTPGRLPIISPRLGHRREPPREWTDPLTHHHIIRLSEEPGSASLYFHQNAYTAKGDLMVFTTRNGLSVIGLHTHKIRSLVDGRVSDVVVGRHSRQVFYF